MEGWKEITIAQVCKVKKGEQLNKLELTNMGDFPCINGGISASGYTHLWNRKENVITISEGGNSCGFVSFQTTKFWSGGHCYTLLNLSDEIQNDFFYHSLKGREKSIMQLRVGSGLPNIQQKAIKSFKFLIPTSLTEQTHIANILSTADQAIAQTEQLIAKYQRIKTGLMHDLLSKGIDEHGNIRDKATHRFVESNLKLKLVPKEWNANSILSDITKVNQGLQIAISERFKEEGKNRYVYITIQYLNNPDKNKEYIQAPNPSVICSKDDILFTRTGNTGQIISNVVGVFHNNFFKVGYDISKVTKEYLIYYLNWQPIQNIIKDLAGTTTIPDMKHKDFYSIPIIFPKTIEEQNSIVKILNANQDFISEEQHNLQKLHSLKTGLMQDLLSGRVRV